jgi:anthranilate/para-aminobenzoate synthase component II
MTRATFVDFDDSFSYNVVQELEEIGISVDVINWKDFEALPETELLVLGPGPGHPDDYQRLFPLLTEWINLERKLFGICLGHQIYWRLLGEGVVRSKEPLHGQKVSLILNETWQDFFQLPEELKVQRYNSLGVPAQAALRHPELKNVLIDDEIMISRTKSVLTYQFHPESLGTMCRQSFFLPLLRDFV